MSRTPKAPKPVRRAAWAVSGVFGWGRALFGIGYFGWAPRDMPHLWGNRTALFATREEARRALAALPYPLTHAERVERVVVEVRPLRSPRKKGTSK